MTSEVEINLDTGSSRMRPSNHRVQRQRVQVTSATVILCVVLGIAAPASAGLYYEAVQATIAEKGKDRTQWRVRTWVDGDSAKIEFDESLSPLLPQGSYLLTSDGGETMTLVNPTEKTTSRWNLDQLIAVFGAVLQDMDGVFNLDFEELSSEALSDEAGPVILGHETRHLRSRVGYTMRMKALGMKRSWTVKTIQDLWVARDIDLPGMGIWLRNSPPSTGNEDFDRLMRSEMKRVDGVVLKSSATSTVVDQKGRARESRTTMEVTKLVEQDVPQSTFQIPAGFKEAERPAGEEAPPSLGDLLGGRKPPNG